MTNPMTVVVLGLFATPSCVNQREPGRSVL